MWMVFTVGTSHPLATRWGRGTLDWRLWFPKEIVKIVQLRKAETDHTSLISSPQFWKSKLIFMFRSKYHYDTNLHPNCIFVKTVAPGISHSSPMYTFLGVLHVSTIHFLARHLKPFKFVPMSHVPPTHPLNPPFSLPAALCASTPLCHSACISSVISFLFPKLPSWDQQYRHHLGNC